MVASYTAELAALLVALTAGLAEWIHARRTRRLAGLAFGPRRRPRTWATAAPLLRVAAMTALVWGFTTLTLLAPKVHRLFGAQNEQPRHLLLLLDVSPSMRLVDAGPLGKQSRRQRTKDLMDSFFQRVSTENYLISVLAFFNGANPVVIDTKDAEVVRHILEDLPLYQAFQPGKTKLFEGLKEAAKIAKPWPPKSGMLLVLTDGDTVPDKGMPKMPASIANTLIVGIGDSRSGSFIAGKQSRQDVSTLKHVAARLRGVYVDGNAKHISSKVLAQLQSEMASHSERWTRREYALLACAFGSLILSVLPVALHWLGTGWQPGVRAADAPRSPGSAAQPHRPPAHRDGDGVAAAAVKTQHKELAKT